MPLTNSYIEVNFPKNINSDKTRHYQNSNKNLKKKLLPRIFASISHVTHQLIFQASQLSARFSSIYFSKKTLGIVALFVTQPLVLSTEGKLRYSSQRLYSWTF